MQIKPTSIIKAFGLSAVPLYLNYPKWDCGLFIQNTLIQKVLLPYGEKDYSPKKSYLATPLVIQITLNSLDSEDPVIHSKQLLHTLDQLD